MRLTAEGFGGVRNLAKSALAYEIRKALDSYDRPEQQIKAVRKVIDSFLIPRALGTVAEIKALAKSELAQQVQDILDDESQLSEEKVGQIRGLIRYFLLSKVKDSE